jgi:hypothetical protein
LTQQSDKRFNRSKRRRRASGNSAPPAAAVAKQDSINGQGAASDLRVAQPFFTIPEGCKNPLSLVSASAAFELSEKLLCKNYNLAMLNMQAVHNHESFSKSF